MLTLEQIDLLSAKGYEVTHRNGKVYIRNGKVYINNNRLRISSNNELYCTTHSTPVKVKDLLKD